jgi:hypothetical protein
MAINRWWESDPAEVYWMEITGRNDLGANLAAPQTDERGDEYVGYTLVREVRHGDVIFHFDRNLGQIVGWSRAVGGPYTGTIVWAARGTSFRQHGGGDAYERPGWVFNLEGPYLFDQPVTLAWLRGYESQVRAVRATLASTHRGTLYFPFAISDHRPLRAAQTYMVKFPAELVRRVPTLAAAGQQAAATYPVSTPVRPQAPRGADAGLGMDYREANEDATTAGRDPLEVDPTLVDRAPRGHAKTQNLLANLLLSRGFMPRSPQPGEPQFYVAWIAGRSLFVAEVKSLTKRNEEQQLRLGLGQVLRYRNLLADGSRQVVAVLALEQSPSDKRWAHSLQGAQRAPRVAPVIQRDMDRLSTMASAV